VSVSSSTKVESAVVAVCRRFVRSKNEVGAAALRYCTLRAKYERAKSFWLPPPPPSYFPNEFVKILVWVIEGLQFDGLHIS